MKEKLVKISKNKDFINRMIIVFVALILALPMCSSKLNVYFDDGIQHIARAYGTFQSIKEQGLYPNIISSFTNNFGYSWNLFYGSLSTFGIILINLICHSYITSYKIFTFIVLIFSGIFMYKFVFAVTQNKNTALLSGIIYLTFPYHLTDLYTRNALGEFVSFIFIPLVFLGLYNLLNNTENHYYLTFGAAGLILTHNLSTLITAFFAIIYLIMHYKSLKETRVKQALILNIVFIVLITAFFWAPFLETKFSADYQVYEKDAMASSKSVSSYALLIPQLFATNPNNTYTFELGIHIIVMLCFSVMTIKLLDYKLKKQYIFALISGIISLVMATNIFPWKIMPSIILMIQFPWRMLAFVGFFASFICAVNMSVVIKKFNIRDVLIIGAISTIYVCALNGFVPYTDNIYDIDSYELGIMTGKEVEVVAGTGKAEYLPKKAFDNRFYIATREDVIYVLSGKAIIEDEEKNGTSYKAKIRTIEEETVFELPYIYYPGYEVLADGMIIENFETDNGFLGIKLDKNDTVQLEVKYTGTKVMMGSMFISIVGIITFGIYVWKKH